MNKSSKNGQKKIPAIVELKNVLPNLCGQYIFCLFIICSVLRLSQPHLIATRVFFLCGFLLGCGFGGVAKAR